MLLRGLFDLAVNFGLRQIPIRAGNEKSSRFFMQKRHKIRFYGKRTKIEHQGNSKQPQKKG